MNYSVTLCNEDAGTGGTLIVLATNDRQAVLQALYGMGWRDHARVIVYPNGEIQGFASDESEVRFFFSGLVRSFQEFS